jgi:hypothetical protein
MNRNILIVILETVRKQKYRKLPIIQANEREKTHNLKTRIIQNILFRTFTKVTNYFFCTIGVCFEIQHVMGVGFCELFRLLLMKVHVFLATVLSLATVQ